MTPEEARRKMSNRGWNDDPHQLIQHVENLLEEMVWLVKNDRIKEPDTIFISVGAKAYTWNAQDAALRHFVLLGWDSGMDGDAFYIREKAK